MQSQSEIIPVYSSNPAILKLKRALIQIRNLYSLSNRHRTMFFRFYELPLRYDDSFIRNINSRKIGPRPPDLITYDKLLTQPIWNMGELTCNIDKEIDLEKFYLNFNIINQRGIPITDDQTYHIYTVWAEYLVSMQTSDHFKRLQLNDYLASLQNAISAYTNQSTLPDPNSVFKDIYSQTSINNKRGDRILFTIELALTVALILSAAASGGSVLSIILMSLLALAVHLHVRFRVEQKSLTRIKDEHNELNEALRLEAGDQPLKSADTLVDEINQDLATSQSSRFGFC